MKVVILAGGYGTRLSEETSVIPKPLVEVAGKPLLWYIMKTYSHWGFNDFIIAAGYKSEKIKSYFADLALASDDFKIDLSTGKVEILKKKAPDWKITVVDTGIETMTGGRIKRAAEHIKEDTFMLTYGDGISDINIKKLLDFHNKHGKIATLTAVRMPRFGILEMDGDLVTSFQEKRLDHSPFINGGYMVLSKRVLDYIDGDKMPFETMPLQRLSEDRELCAYKYEGFWKCVDTLKDKKDLEKIFENGDGVAEIWKV
jgi:glucose-1-phosphate cytidylyltransferase